MIDQLALPPTGDLPTTYRTVPLELPRGIPLGCAALYRHHTTWVAVTQQGSRQRWYGIGCTRVEAVQELLASLTDEPPE